MRVNNHSMHELKNDLYKAMKALQEAIDHYIDSIEKGNGDEKDNTRGKTSGN